MLVDANVLLYAWDERSTWHDGAREWLTEKLNGPVRVGLPWESLCAFVRIATNPRAVEAPLTPDQAWRHVKRWTAARAVWIPGPTNRHADILGGLVEAHQLRGGLISDAHLAAIAIGHGLTLVSHDTHFAMFRGLRWENPLE